MGPLISSTRGMISALGYSFVAVLTFIIQNKPLFNSCRAQLTRPNQESAMTTRLNSAEAKAAGAKRRGKAVAIDKTFKVGSNSVNLTASGHNNKVHLPLVLAGGLCF